MSIFGWLFRNKDLFKQVIGTGRIYETSGTETIAGATDVFEQIDPAFKAYIAPGHIKNGDKTIALMMTTPKTHLVAHELQRDATLREMFEWLTKKLGKTLDELCLTQHQIRNLAVQCPQLLKESGATFILFKCCDQHCVALISRKQDETLAVDLRLLDLTITWGGEFHPHVIIPM